MALARSAGTVNKFMISDNATADTTAPPKPCKPRAKTSIHGDCATPQASEVTVNSVMPPKNKLRCPYKSPSRPPSSKNPPNVSM